MTYFNQAKLNAVYILFLFSDSSFPTEIVEKTRQLYGTREQSLLPVPWCEDFSFHLNEIFTRLKIVSKEETRGVLTDDITNMTAIFKPHVECQSPRTVLIEGDSGMGKLRVQVVHFRLMCVAKKRHCLNSLILQVIVLPVDSESSSLFCVVCCDLAESYPFSITCLCYL